MLSKSGTFGIIILFMITFAEEGIEGQNIVGCPSAQVAVLGSPGYIICNVPSDLSEIIWYNHVPVTSDVVPVARYRLQAGEKSGTGVDSGEYDVLPNGTLVMTRVTLNNERNYIGLFCTPSNCNTQSTVYVTVIVYPSEVTPSIGYCNDRGPCVYSFTQHGHLTCQFDSARPHVDLEWAEQVRGTDIQIESQNSSNELNSDDVTYKSYAILNEVVSNDRLLAVYSCKPRWITTGVVTERSILVDFSEETGLLNQPPEETVFYEINRRSELRSKVSNFSELIWRKISSSGKIETIGFIYESVIHTNEDFSEDITVSADGSLIFTSLQLHHEGSYACLYDNGGDVKGMHIPYLQVLVPPSPPYIEIRECQGNSPCFINGQREGRLTCVLNGVRPEVSLTWIAENDKLVILRYSKTVIQSRGQLTDVSVSINYEVGSNVCGTTVELQCHVGHPISQIIQPFVQAMISSDDCTDRDDGGDQRNGIPSVLAVTIAVVCVFSVLIACFGIYYILQRSKNNHRTQDQMLTFHEVEANNLMTKYPNEHVGRNSGDSAEDVVNDVHRSDIQTENNEIKIPLDHCNGNGLHT